MYDYDVAILGGGPGGYEAAIRCAQYGLRVALIEARELGGTCLNRGCIPTKALLHGAEVYQSVLDAKSLGIKAEAVTLDYAALVAYKDRQVTKLRRGVEALEKAYGVTVIAGFGRLTGQHELCVGETSLTAGSIILATGSKPAVPPIPGIENAIDSDAVLSMTALPQSAAIIGGGVIGIELATLLSSLGCRVTVLEMLPDILPGVDAQLTKLLRASLQKKKAAIVCGARVLAVESDGQIRYEENGQQKTVEAQCRICCTGRVPMTRDIGLEQLGIKTERGFVQVNARMQTNVEPIYAIGDITGKMQLAHVATAQGMIAAAACAGKPVDESELLVPACVYTHPEIAYVGLTEQAAQKLCKPVTIGTFDVAGNGRATVTGERVGLAKLVCDAESGRLLGAQLMAPNATEMIGELTAIIKLGGTVEQLSSVIHPHPTVSEIIMEAAHDAEGLCCHAAPKKV